MTEHLPECAVAAARPGTFTSCICDALRACEARVIDNAVNGIWAYLQHDVADGWMPRSKAEGIISVIDALREEEP